MKSENTWLNNILLNPCPECKAPAGSPCLSLPSGRARNLPHRGRRQLAEAPELPEFSPKPKALRPIDPDKLTPGITLLRDRHTDDKLSLLAVHRQYRADEVIIVFFKPGHGIHEFSLASDYLMVHYEYTNDAAMDGTEPKDWQWFPMHE